MRDHDVRLDDRASVIEQGSSSENNHIPAGRDLPLENIFGHTKKLQYILHHLAEVVRRNPQARILDFGCGNGSAVSQFLIAALPDTSSYTGVDIHPESVAHANAHFGKKNAVFVRLDTRWSV